MKKINLIVDYSFLYYKYKFTVQSGRIRKVSADVKGFYEDNPDKVEKRDVSMLYYPLKEIEGFRKALEENGDKVSLSVCFDMPSARAEEDEGYKANRIARLGEDDFNNIGYTKRVLEQAGHATYRFEGTEADDIVYSLVHHDKTKEMFSNILVVTPDLDLAINVDKECKVALYRYKAKQGYSVINYGNFEAYMSSNLGTRVPFNSIMLTKATLGDASDNIKGINKFGKVAHDKLISKLMCMGVDFDKLVDYEYTYKVINENVREILGSLAADEALDSLSLVRPRTLEVEPVFHVSTKEEREAAYMPLMMKSLVD